MVNSDSLKLVWRQEGSPSSDWPRPRLGGVGKLSFSYDGFGWPWLDCIVPFAVEGERLHPPGRRSRNSSTESLVLPDSHGALFLGLLEIEWAILGVKAVKNAGGHGLLCAWSGPESRHHERCQNQARDNVGFRTGIRSRASGRERAFVAYSLIQMCGSSRSIGAQKNNLQLCGRVQMGWYDRRLRRVRDLSSAGFRIVLELEVRRIECGACASVKRERLDFLAANPHFTSTLPSMSGVAAGLFNALY
jgi:hypothetical protein